MKALAIRAALLAVAIGSSAAADARFLQTDPVGYDDQVNLYVYVNNDPVNRVDPTGRDTIVLVRENGDVNIVLPITFSGDAATPRNVESAINNIQSTFSGRLDGVNVTTTVVRDTSPIDPSVHNTMSITNDNTSRIDPIGGSQGHSYVKSGTEGHVTMKDVNGVAIRQPNGSSTVGDKGGSTYAHEGGHQMGLPDAPTSRGIMGPGPGTSVTGGDIRAISRTNTKTSINTVIQCPDVRCNK